MLFLLDQKARICARQRRVPGAPFIDDEGDLLLRVVLVHHCRLLAHQVFPFGAWSEDLAVFGLAESPDLYEGGQRGTV